MSRLKILAVSGVKNSGKTTLIARLLPLLKEKGLKVSVLKHDGHSFNPEREGTDTKTYYDSGAYSWGIFDNGKFSFTKKERVNADRLFSLFEGSDLLILEGFKQSDYPKLELIRKTNGETPVCKSETVLAYVTDFPLEHFKPVFSFDELEALRDFIIKNVIT